MAPDFVLNVDESLLPVGETVLAAVSSGGDSIALLLWLLKHHPKFVVAHVHHDLYELRNGDCDRDEAFVRAVCEKHSIRYLHRKIDLARKNGHVNEVVAREGRYEALLEMAQECGATRVATAHSANDLFETAVLGLLRGASFGGWKGFLPERPLSSQTTANIALVRPFWKIERQELRRFLVAHQWEWREDESNLSHHFRRNRIRHEVLPLFEQISGHTADSISAAFAKNTVIAREEHDFLEIEARKAFDSLIIKRESNLISLDGFAFGDFHIAVQRRVLRMAVLEIAPTLRDLSFEKVEATRLVIANGGKRAVWNWRKDLFIEWTGQGSGNRIRLWLV